MINIENFDISRYRYLTLPQTLNNPAKYEPDSLIRHLDMASRSCYVSQKAVRWKQDFRYMHFSRWYYPPP